MTTYTLNELAEASGETRYTIRHYIARRLMPPAEGSGSHRHFTDDHLHRLLAIRALRGEGLRDQKLFKRVDSASDEEIRALAGVEEPAPPPPPPPLPAPPAPAVVAAPSPPPAPPRDLRRAVQSIVIAAADALDVAPKHARAAVVAVLAQMQADGIEAAEALGILRE